MHTSMRVFVLHSVRVICRSVFPKTGWILQPRFFPVAHIQHAGVVGKEGILTKQRKVLTFSGLHFFFVSGTIILSSPMLGI